MEGGVWLDSVEMENNRGRKTRWRQGLLRLLAGQVRRFTMGDSSSVPAETAKALMESIEVCLQWYLSDAAGEGAIAPEDADPENLFSLALQSVEARLQTGRERYRKALAGELPVENLAYHETLKEIGLFFRMYDYRYFAQDIPCTITYPLCHDVGELPGIAYINAFLERMILENRFCVRFSPGRVTRLLRRVCPDFREYLVNIYEPVAFQSLGLALLGKEAAELSVTAEEREILTELFLRSREEEMEARLVRAVGDLCAALNLQEEDREYLNKTARMLREKAGQTVLRGTLEYLFVSVDGSGGFPLPAQYVDGHSMGDEALRELIADLGPMALEDKMAAVRERVHSLMDLAEILEACFWSEEFDAFFCTMGREELAILSQFARQQAGEGAGQRSRRWVEGLRRFLEHC